MTLYKSVFGPAKHEEVERIFETVMQTWDVVEGLNNFQEFSQPPKCLDEAM